MKKIFFVLLVFVGVLGISADELKLDLLFTNDIHGGIDRYPATFMNPDFPPMLGGGGVAATYINRVRAKSEEGKRDHLLVDVGDFFQGHPIGTMSDGEAVIKYMNMIGYDLMVIGNHEYDISEERLKEVLSMAEFPILSCNIVKKGTDELVDYVQPYIIVEKMGVKIGIIGLTTTDTAKMSFPENIKNVDFLNAKESLQKWIPIVEEQGVDLLFVAGHMGIPYDAEAAYKRRYENELQEERERNWGYDAQELAHEVEGIDVFFAGHIHVGYADPWEDPVTHTLVLQGYAYGSNVGHITLKIDKETKTITGYELPSLDDGALITLFEDEFIPHPGISDTIAYYQQKAEEGMDEVIGIAEEQISRRDVDAQSEIGNLVCQSMLFATDADFAFLNMGGVRSDIQKGPITYRDVFNVMPFDNQIVTFEASGEFLKRIIEMRVSGTRHGLRIAGGKVVYSRKREDYDRITKLEIAGEPWRADKTYQVATTDFLLQGNAGLTMLTKIPEEKITRYEKNLRDAIVDYIRRHSPLNIKIDDRWIRDDNSQKTKELQQELNKLNSK
ncbi:MAG: bifunctional UDP-sugar hydrolase/5'-nucleotidase [Candidatus Cloacimonadota bacterium]|nr:bifunctional UDP-sugar hydrolase/5'-nucleotidase [Candidatus Cloacimonadota bacterium]